MMVADWTRGSIFGLPWPPGSSRFIVETISREQPGRMARDADGAPLALIPDHDRIILSYSCDDNRPPPFAGLRRGDQGTVETMGRMPAATVTGGATAVTLERDPVAGSVQAVSEDGDEIEVTDVTGRDVTLASHTGAAAIYYRASLTCQIWRLREQTFDQQPGQMSWAIELREV